MLNVNIDLILFIVLISQGAVIVVACDGGDDAVVEQKSAI